jgi:cyclohexyl-isocyanide hydratase
MLDLVGPLDVLTLLPDAEVQIVGKRSQPVVSDSGASLLATHSFADAWEDVDLIAVPGGGSTVDVLHDGELLEYVADRGSRATWVTSVCTGSLILGVAGLLKGYEAASYWYTRELLRRFGAIPQGGACCQ